MASLRKILYCTLGSPFSWLGACIFRPTIFKRVFESRKERWILLLRLFLPLIIVSYPFTVIVFNIVFSFVMIVHGLFHSSGAFEISSSTNFWLISLVTTTFGVGVGLCLGARLGVAWSIVGGIVLGIILGVAGEVGWILAWTNPLPFDRLGQALLVAGLTAISGALLGCLAGTLAGYIGLDIGRGITLGVIGGLVGGATGGFFGGISLGIIAGMFLAIFAGILGGMGKGILVSMGRGPLVEGRERMLMHFLRGWRGRSDVVVGYIAGIEIGIPTGISVGILGGVLMRLLLMIPVRFPFFSILQRKAEWGITVNLLGGLAWGSAFGCVVGSTCGIWLGIVMGGVGGISWGLALGIAIGLVCLISSLLSLLFMGGLTGGIACGIGVSVLGSLTFVCFYIVSCYRWPLYPISMCSSIRAYCKSRKNPSKVFDHLKHSVLYWDESGSPMPLLYLEKLLMCAVEQDHEKALEVMLFISHKRAAQIGATQIPTYEIAVRTLEACIDLERIAAVSGELKQLGAIRLEWMEPFVALNNVSEGVTLYLSSRRQDTLKGVKENLENVLPYKILSNKELARRLDRVVRNWRDIVQRELAVHPRELGQLENPYCPGPVLSGTHSPFVGRHDLIRMLEAGLQKGRERSTLMLWGERRMGKSSTLQQLPNRLDSHQYIPVFYDLQCVSTLSNTPTLLFTIADSIQSTLSSHNIRVEALSFGLLKEANKENEGFVYHEFDTWLKKIELILIKEQKTLFLLFDEFEQLVKIAERQFIDVGLLLDFFRHIIQYRPQLALLFSSRQPLGEMPSVGSVRWTDYFVNFQAHKVSFLRVDEAHLLITHPIALYPSTQIFGEDVVEKIIELTGCHPYLVQVVCSTFIDHLNAVRRIKANLSDIGTVIDQTLERCRDTYFRELWERTSEDQKSCMHVLDRLGEANLHEIAQQSTLSERVVGEALLKLGDRDLILHNETGNYRLAVPLFSHWLRRYIYFSQF